MFFINPVIAALVVLVTPVSLFVASFIAKRTYSMFRMQSQTRGELTSLVEEMLGNQKVVKAFAYEDEAQKKFEAINEDLRIWGLKATFFSSITNPANPVCKQSGLCVCRNCRSICCSQWRFISGTAVQLSKFMPTSIQSRLMRFPVW